MYIISLNILFKDKDRKIILTETPYLFVHDDLKKIILEIRRMVYEDFPPISDEMGIPLLNLSLGMTTFSNDEMHFFEVDYKNIKKYNGL